VRRNATWTRVEINIENLANLATLIARLSLNEGVYLSLRCHTDPICL